ncbi:MAG: UPF0147 family protein [Candidatus Micrarchaeia archaeon]
MAKKPSNSEKRIREIIEFMDALMEDVTVPKNIKKAINDAKEKLLGTGDPVFRATSAIYILEGVSEDINLPMHARTQIWNIVSSLEMIKGD